MEGFWNGYNLDNFIFERLNISSIEGFSGVLLAILGAALVYEGIQSIRDVLMDRFLEKRKSVLSQGTKSFPITVTFINSPVHDAGDIKDKDMIQINSPVKGISNSKEGGVSVISNKCCSQVLPSDEVLRGSQLVGIVELTVSTVLHMINICLGYVLMLAVMTFNVWILIAVTIGAGSGFFVFDVLKRKFV